MKSFLKARESVGIWGHLVRTVTMYIWSLASLAPSQWSNVLAACIDFDDIGYSCFCSRGSEFQAAGGGFLVSGQWGGIGI